MEANDDTEIDLWKLLKDGLKFFSKRKRVILIFMLMGLFFALGKFITHPLQYKSFYKTDFIVQSSFVTNEILSEIIYNFSLNAEPVPHLKQITRKLEANSKKETRLRVTFETYEKINMDSLINKIVAFVDTVEYIRERNNLMRRQSLELLVKLNKQITAFENEKENIKPIADTINKNAEYVSYIELLEKKQNIEKELALSKSIEFIEKNSPSIFVSSRRTIILNVFGYSFLGFVIGAIIGFLMNYRKQSIPD